MRRLADNMQHGGKLFCTQKQLRAGALSGSLGSLTSLTQGGSIWDSGEWWMLLAAQSMAVGTVMVPWVCKFVDPVMATGYHMLLGGLPLLVLSIYQESDVLLERLPQLTGGQHCTLPHLGLYPILAWGLRCLHGAFSGSFPCARSADKGLQLCCPCAMQDCISDFFQFNDRNSRLWSPACFAISRHFLLG